MRYTDEQIAAIAAPLGDAAVVAAAGSGKTSVAAWRVAYLLKQHGFEPQNVAAMTFGKEAAVQLSSRIIRTVEEKVSRPVFGVPELFAGTIHSFAMHALKAHLPRFRKFEVLGEAERRLLVRRRFDRLGIGRIPRLAVGTGGGPDAALNFLTVAPEDVALFLDAIDRARDECLHDAALPRELLDSLRAYEAALDRAASWDYGSLIQAFLRALSEAEDADCLALQGDLRERLRVLIADEAQDLDRAMWRLLSRLRGLGVSVWCIGDHRQSVYRWRSADPHAFLAFPAWAGAPTYALSSNFRSSEGVVSLANAFCARFLGAGAAMRAASHHVHEEGDIAALRFATRAEQYQWIARRLRSLRGTTWRDGPDSLPRGLSQADMTVLVRTRRQMAEVAAALRAEGLDVIVSGVDGLLVPPEAEALATVADFLGGGRAAWDRKARRLVTAPVCQDDVRAAARAAFGDADEASVERGVAWLCALPLSGDWERPVCLIEMLETWLQVMGVQYTGNGGAREEAGWLATRRVLDAAAAYQRWGFASALREKVAGFARWLRVEAGSVMRDEREEGGLRLAPDAVTVQTCHNAKGLEYAVVAVPDLAEGRFPARARPSDLWQVWPRERLTPAEARRLDGTYSDKLRDEANLFYVALTRAAKYLLLTYAPPEGAKRPRVSQFFEFTERHPVVTRDPNLLPRVISSETERLTLTTRRETSAIQVTATKVAAYWSCPRQFYLRFVLNFPPHLKEEIGFGSGLHNAAWDVHHRVREGQVLSPCEVADIAECHLHLPFAGVATREKLRAGSVNALTGYVTRLRSESASKMIAVEREVRLDLGAMTVIGRVDLITQDTGGETLVELKTTSDEERDPEQMVAKIYALAYEATTGSLPTQISTRVISADPRKDRVTPLTPGVVATTRNRIEAAGVSMVRRHFPPLPMAGSNTCNVCDVRDVCSAVRFRRDIVKEG